MRNEKFCSSPDTLVCSQFLIQVHHTCLDVCCSSTHLNIEGKLIRTGLSHFNPNARINVGKVCLQITDTLKLYMLWVLKSL